jgi:hypothetical protein
MISGKKRLDDTSASAERPGAPAWRMIVAAGLVAVTGAFLFAKTDFTALATAQAEHRDTDHEDNE